MASKKIPKETSQPMNRSDWISFLALLFTVVSFIYNDTQSEKLKKEVFNKVDSFQEKLDAQYKEAQRQKLADAQIVELGHTIEIPISAITSENKRITVPAFKIKNLGEDTLQELSVMWEGLEVNYVSFTANERETDREREMEQRRLDKAAQKAILEKPITPQRGIINSRSLAPMTEVQVTSVPTFLELCALHPNVRFKGLIKIDYVSRIHEYRSITKRFRFTATHPRMQSGSNIVVQIRIYSHFEALLDRHR